MQDNSVKQVVILGGGSAGWLTAGLLAAEHYAHRPDGLKITLIESADVPVIGVGEGTWPSMRTTLKKIGVSETDLFVACDASFKQGAKFVRWTTGKTEDGYYHPLVLPSGNGEMDLVQPWLQTLRDKTPFADAVCAQGAVCEAGLAPKLITTPEYDAILNYAYHLDSNKLGVFLKNHCVNKLGVVHVADHVQNVVVADSGEIQSLQTKQHGDLKADLFIDCSGLASLLLGKSLNVPFVCKKNILFNDAALAVQVPYAEPHSAIASHTISTAQSAGWIWDIGLPTRKGVGVVYSTAHISDDLASQELLTYASKGLNSSVVSELLPRKIAINPGHRKVFWYKNCVAIGMSAGFLEPLEASALVLIESAARMLSADFPSFKDAMPKIAQRFNQRFQYYWDTIVDFLKLHYVLSHRTDTEYWRDNTNKESIPDSLRERLELWKLQEPNKYDFPMTEEMFPAASWQYVLYGMGFSTAIRPSSAKNRDLVLAKPHFDNVKFFSEKALSALPSNRELIRKIHQYGLHKV